MKITHLNYYYKHFLIKTLRVNLLTKRESCGVKIKIRCQTREYILFGILKHERDFKNLIINKLY